MKCKCEQLTDVFYLDDSPKGFQKGFKELDAKEWMKLFECTKCGTFWVIDEWDKYTWQVASKLKNRNDWPSQIPEDKRKELLLKSRGGTDEEPCIWQDCDQKRVKGVVHCIDHLWSTGARK